MHEDGFTGADAARLLEEIAPLLLPWQHAAVEVLTFHRAHGYYPPRGDVVALVRARRGVEVSLSTARRALRWVLRSARADFPRGISTAHRWSAR